MYVASQGTSARKNKSQHSRIFDVVPSLCERDGKRLFTFIIFILLVAGTFDKELTIAERKVYRN
jgi:hypothetical protein